MANAQLFQYAILWHPTEKQVKDEGLKSKLLVTPQTVLAEAQQSVLMLAATQIPKEYLGELEQVQIAVRPF